MFDTIVISTNYGVREKHNKSLKEFLDDSHIYIKNQVIIDGELLAIAYCAVRNVEIGTVWARL